MIASRYDLSEENPNHFGAVDSKVTSTTLHNQNMGVWAVNGPTVDGCPAFSLRLLCMVMNRWSEWMKTHTAIQHIGHPDVFNFDYIYMDLNHCTVC